MKKSINAWTFPDALDFEACLVAAKEAGFDAVEFNLDRETSASAHSFKLSTPDGESYTGTGLSTDIIESSIRAYVNGINKMMDASNN